MILIQGTKTRHTAKTPKTSSALRAAVARAARCTPRPNTAEKTPPIDLDRASQIEIQRPMTNDRTKRENRDGTRQRGRVERYAQTQQRREQRTDHQTRKFSKTHKILRVPEIQEAPVPSPAAGESPPARARASSPGTHALRIVTRKGSFFRDVGVGVRRR